MLKKNLLWFMVLALLFSLSSSVLSAEAPQKRSIVKMGEDITVPRYTEIDSAVAIGGSVIHSGRAQDIVSIGGNVLLKSGSLVNGSVVSVGGKIEKEPGATVRGDTVVVKAPLVSSLFGFMAGGTLLEGLLIVNIFNFVGFLLLAIVIVAFFAQPLGRVSASVEKSMFKSFLWGLLAMLVFVPVIIVLAISIVGIIFIPVWMVLAAAAVLFGYIAAAQFFGKKILSAFKITKQPLMLEAILGVFLLWLIGLVPIAGWLIKLIAALCGLGAVVVTRFGMQKG